MPNKNENSHKLNAFTLAALGTGSIIGSGIFLGSSIAIRQTGPSAVLAFLLSGLIITQYMGAMVSVSVNRPVIGSTKVYASQFLGRFAGFLAGWMLVISNVLALASEAVAAGVFLRYWLPHVPVAALAMIAVLLVVFINRLSLKDFSIVESIMAILKIAVLLLFIFIGFGFIFNKGIAVKPYPFENFKSVFPSGLSGFLQSMLIAIFTFSGIGTVTMATIKVRNPKNDIPKAAAMLMTGIIALYVISLFIIICVVNPGTANTTI